MPSKPNQEYRVGYNQAILAALDTGHQPANYPQLHDLATNAASVGGQYHTGFRVGLVHLLFAALDQLRGHAGYIGVTDTQFQDALVDRTHIVLHGSTDDVPANALLLDAIAAATEGRAEFVRAIEYPPSGVARNIWVVAGAATVATHAWLAAFPDEPQSWWMASAILLDAALTGRS